MKIYGWQFALFFFFMACGYRIVYANDTGIDGGFTTVSSLTVTGPVFMSSLNVSTVTVTSSSTITNLTITSNAIFQKNLVFNPATNGIAGTITNDNAIGGVVGEYISSSTVAGNAIPLISANVATVATIYLTPGDWDINAMPSVAVLSAGVNTSVLGYVSSVPGNNISGIALGDNGVYGPTPTASADSNMAIAGLRKSLTAGTSFYLKIDSGFTSGTYGAYGRMSARRIR